MLLRSYWQVLQLRRLSACKATLVPALSNQAYVLVAKYSVMLANDSKHAMVHIVIAADLRGR